MFTFKETLLYLGWDYYHAYALHYTYPVFMVIAYTVICSVNDFLCESCRT